jgi:hypothetical protein
VPVPNGPGTIDVVVSLDGGSNTYCLRFTGTGDGNKFLVKESGPGTCPGGGPVCGNNIIEGTEQCDGTQGGACPGQCQSCTCPAPSCGNGTLDPGEACDPAFPAALGDPGSCYNADPFYNLYSLPCNPNCTCPCGLTQPDPLSLVCGGECPPSTECTSIEDWGCGCLCTETSCPPGFGCNGAECIPVGDCDVTGCPPGWFCVPADNQCRQFCFSCDVGGTGCDDPATTCQMVDIVCLCVP